MDSYDVIIVGAGPAGSTAAFYIEKKKALIVDKSKFPRYKPCGGGLLNSEDWVEEFANFNRIKPRLRYHRVNEGQIYFNHKELFSRRTHFFDQVERAYFDNLLLQEALKKENIDFRQFRVTMIKRRGDQIFLSNGTEIIATKYLIGADGVNSVVSRFLGNKSFSINQAARCVGYEISCRRKDNVAHLSWMWQNEIGFAWAFPSQKGYNLGVGCARRTNRPVSEYCNDFLKFCRERGIVPKEYQVTKKFGGLDPVYVPRRICSDRIILTGDAMGLVYQFNGEGIYFAMKSGKIAGKLLNSNYSARKYQKQVHPVVKEVMISHWIPWRWLTVSLFWLSFSLMRCKLPIIQKKLHNLSLNLFLRRYNLSKHTKYRKL